MRTSRMRLLALVQSRSEFWVYFELNTIITSPNFYLMPETIKSSVLWNSSARRARKPGFFSQHHSSHEIVGSSNTLLVLYPDSQNIRWSTIHLFYMYSSEIYLVDAPNLLFWVRLCTMSKAAWSRMRPMRLLRIGSISEMKAWGDGIREYLNFVSGWRFRRLQEGSHNHEGFTT
jgi:hypothetical protein